MPDWEEPLGGSPGGGKALLAYEAFAAKVVAAPPPTFAARVATRAAATVSRLRSASAATRQTAATAAASLRQAASGVKLPAGRNAQLASVAAGATFARVLRAAKSVQPVARTVATQAAKLPGLVVDLKYMSGGVPRSLRLEWSLDGLRRLIQNVPKLKLW